MIVCILFSAKCILILIRIKSDERGGRVSPFDTETTSEMPLRTMIKKESE